MQFRKIQSLEELAKLLAEYDGSAVRTISSRTGDLQTYAKKLLKYGKNFVLSGGEKEHREGGFVSFYGNDTENKTIYLTIIAIHPAFQRQGFGTAVINYLEQFGKEKGMRRIKLEVDKENTGAIRFYRKTGFQITEEASGESFFMEKEI